MKKRTSGWAFFAFVVVVTAILALPNIGAEPIGPTISVLSNSTMPNPNSTKVNSTNGTISPGGFIFTLLMDSEQQNRRWKAYVGNVTGKLVLDDADGNSIFQWQLSAITGEVYASRASTSINWTGINCSWVADGKTNRAEGLSSNRTPEHNENIILSQTNKDDNVTATFRYKNHSSIEVGSRAIGKDECFSLQTWQRNAEQTFGDSDNANFTQVLLYDAALGKTDGNIIYATELETDKTGYRTDQTYDFQLVLPEVGTSSWTSSTPYYFYVELT